MYEIEDQDLKLSEKFKAAQLKLEIKKQEIIAVNKKENNDTIEACLLFQSNVSYFKEKTKGYKIVDKPNSIAEELLNDFPKADYDILLKIIKKEGFVTYSQLSIFIFICLLMGYLSIVIYSCFTVSFSTLLTFIIPLTLFFVILFLFLDSYIINIRR